MANRLPSIFQQFFTANPTVREGSKLWAYAAGTTTPLNTYKDKDLTPGQENTNPIILDELGQPPFAIFLQTLGYKFKLTDENNVEIWTEDNVFTSDYSARAKLQGYNGNPNGNVAGTEASATVGGDVIWDYANDVMYVCTTTGVAAAAVWTAINLTASVSNIPMPQGYLTLQSSLPVLASDFSSATSIFYALDQGNLVPIYNGSSFSPTVFTELTLSLASAHLVNTIYDVFVFSNAGVLTLVTGPAWTASTVGSGNRGAGAAATGLSRVNGVLVNEVQIAGRNGASTYTIAANMATYIGSIHIDGVAGQVSCHRSAGQNRKWGVWNAYNRKKIILKCTDPTATWNYNSTTVRASNGAPASFTGTDFNFGSGTTCNGINLFTGLAQELKDIRFTQRLQPGQSSALGVMQIGIGYNSTTTGTGATSALFSSNNSNFQVSVMSTLIRTTTNIGVNIAVCLEATPTAGGAANQQFYGSEDWMVMTATYRG